MGIVSSQIHTGSPEFTRNTDAMRRLVDDLHQLLASISQGGGEKAQQRHLSRGKLLPRQRIDALLDPGSAFLEIGQLTAHQGYGEDRSETRRVGRECKHTGERAQKQKHTMQHSSSHVTDVASTAN